MISGLSISHPARFLSIPVIILAVLLSSCIKEEFNPDVLDPTLQINPGVAAPIGWARYQLDEMLTDSLFPDELVIAEDGFISFIYSQDLYSLQANSLISIPDFSPGSTTFQNNTGFPIDLNALPPSGLGYSDTLRYNMPDRYQQC